MGLSDDPTLAIRGALGFLSRLPVGRTERAWAAFRGALWTLPVAGFLLGALVAVPVGLAVLAPMPAPTVAFVYLLALVGLTGINHADGVADLGDAAVVHGESMRRHEVMGDTTLGVGGTLALAVVVVGLALAGLELATVPVVGAVGLVVAAEVSAKAAMGVLVALGTPAHDGFGAAVAGESGPAHLLPVLALSLPATALGYPTLAGVVALAAGVAVALALGEWARRRLDGVTGDVIGAGNELARVVALHAGLTAWHAGDVLARLVDAGALLSSRVGATAAWAGVAPWADVVPLGAAWVGAVPLVAGVVAWTRS